MSGKFCRFIILLLLVIDFSDILVQASECSEMRSLKARRLCRMRQDERRKREQEFWDFNIDVMEESNGQQEEKGQHDIMPTTQPAPEATTATVDIQDNISTANKSEDHTTASEQEITEITAIPTSSFLPDGPGPVTYLATASTPGLGGFDDLLPECTDLVDEEPDEGFNCKISPTTPPPEIRWRDMVFEEMVKHTWNNFNNRITPDMIVVGSPLDPLDMDTIMGGGIEEHPTGVLTADMKMWNIKINGLSTITMDQVLVTRSTDLEDFQVDILFGFDDFLVYGNYSLKGTVGWFEIDSDGEREFSMDLIGPTLNPRMTLKLVEDDSENDCGQFSRLRITNFEMPLRFNTTEVKFVNLGSFYNQALNTFSTQMIGYQEEKMVKQGKDMINSYIKGLFC